MDDGREPGTSAEADVGRLDRILVPAVYLDWNVLQYLRSPGPSDVLLRTLVEPEVRSALAVPFSTAHLLDATAAWTAASMTQRAERLRMITFADGVVRSTRWDIADTDAEERHLLVSEAMWSGAQERGLLTTVDELRNRAPALVASAEAVVVDEIEKMLRQVGELVADLEPESKALSLAIADAAAAALRNELPTVSDAGSLYMRIMRPFFERIVRMLRDAGCDSDRLCRADPQDAVPLLDRFLAGFDPPTNMDALVQGPAAGSVHPDALGPTMLGTFGYYPEDRRKVRRASPGFLADSSHARFALNSAVFITGDIRLAMRVESWANHTARGLLHRRWPIVVAIKPGDPQTLSRAAEVVLAVARAFPRDLADLTA